MQRDFVPLSLYLNYSCSAIPCGVYSARCRRCLVKWTALSYAVADVLRSAGVYGAHDFSAARSAALRIGFDLAVALPAERWCWCGCCSARAARDRERQAPTRWNEGLETAAGPASDERRVRGRLRARRALSRSRARDASGSPTQRFSAAMRAAERTSHGDQAARPAASWGIGGERSFFRRDAFRGEKNAANRAPLFCSCPRAN